MRRREFIALLGGAAAFPLTARAQQQSLPLIGFMGVGPFAGPDIRRGLADNGLVQGRDFRAEYRWADFDPGCVKSPSFNFRVEHLSQLRRCGNKLHWQLLSETTIEKEILYVPGSSTFFTRPGPEGDMATRCDAVGRQLRRLHHRANEKQGASPNQ